MRGQFTLGERIKATDSKTGPLDTMVTCETTFSPRSTAGAESDISRA